MALQVDRGRWCKFECIWLPAITNFLAHITLVCIRMFLFHLGVLLLHDTINDTNTPSYSGSWSSSSVRSNDPKQLWFNPWTAFFPTPGSRNQIYTGSQVHSVDILGRSTIHWFHCVYTALHPNNPVYCRPPSILYFVPSFWLILKINQLPYPHVRTVRLLMVTFQPFCHLLLCIQTSPLMCITQSFLMNWKPIFSPSEICSFPSNASKGR